MEMEEGVRCAEIIQLRYHGIKMKTSKKMENIIKYRKGIEYQRQQKSILNYEMLSNVDKKINKR